MISCSENELNGVLLSVALYNSERDEADAGIERWCVVHDYCCIRSEVAAASLLFYG